MFWHCCCRCCVRLCRAMRIETFSSTFRKCFWWSRSLVRSAFFFFFFIQFHFTPFPLEVLNSIYSFCCYYCYLDKKKYFILFTLFRGWLRGWECESERARTLYKMWGCTIKYKWNTHILMPKIKCLWWARRAEWGKKYAHIKGWALLASQGLRPYQKYV